MPLPLEHIHADTWVSAANSLVLQREAYRCWYRPQAGVQLRVPIGLRSRRVPALMGGFLLIPGASLKGGVGTRCLPSWDSELTGSRV